MMGRLRTAYALIPRGDEAAMVAFGDSKYRTILPDFANSTKVLAQNAIAPAGNAPKGNRHGKSLSEARGAHTPRQRFGNLLAVGVIRPAGSVAGGFCIWG